MIPPFKPFEDIMPYRYRDEAGSTPKSIKAFQNLAKLGEIVLVRGQRWKTKTLGIREGVLCKNAKKETARFNAVLWGYPGEGPRGTIALLKLLGLPDGIANNIGYDTPRQYPDLGADWELRKLDRDGGWEFYIKRTVDAKLIHQWTLVPEDDIQRATDLTWHGDRLDKAWIKKAA